MSRQPTANGEISIANNSWRASRVQNGFSRVSSGFKAIFDPPSRGGREDSLFPSTRFVKMNGLPLPPPRVRDRNNAQEEEEVARDKIA